MTPGPIALSALLALAAVPAAEAIDHLQVGEAVDADELPLLGGGGVKEVVPFVVLVLVLMIRPYGLFGTREVERL